MLQLLSPCYTTVVPETEGHLLHTECCLMHYLLKRAFKQHLGCSMILWLRATQVSHRAAGFQLEGKGFASLAPQHTPTELLPAFQGSCSALGVH
jgi:hypothetical protein